MRFPPGLPTACGPRAPSRSLLPPCEEDKWRPTSASTSPATVTPPPPSLCIPSLYSCQLLGICHQAYAFDVEIFVYFCGP
jgi:hypothetical protein